MQTYGTLDVMHTACPKQSCKSACRLPFDTARTAALCCAVRAQQNVLQQSYQAHGVMHNMQQTPGLNVTITYAQQHVSTHLKKEPQQKEVQQHSKKHAQSTASELRWQEPAHGATSSLANMFERHQQVDA